MRDSDLVKLTCYVAHTLRPVIFVRQTDIGICASKCLRGTKSGRLKKRLLI